MASLNTTGEQLSPAPPPTVHLPLDTGYSAMAAHEELQRLKDMHHGATQRRRGSVIRRQDLAKAKLAQRLSIKKGKAMKKFGALNAFARGLKGDWKVGGGGDEGGESEGDGESDGPPRPERRRRCGRWTPPPPPLTPRRSLP